MIKINELQKTHKEFIKELEQFFNISIVHPRIITVTTRKEFETIACRLRTPRWVVATVAQQNILIFNKKVMEKETGHPAKKFDSIIKHELVHLFYNKKTGGHQPLWLNEGLAYYLTGTKPKATKIVKTDIMDLFTKREFGSVKDAHEKGYLMVKLLMDACEK